MPGYLLSDNVYNILKWDGLIALPALATFVGAVGPLWGIPNTDAIVQTITAIGVLVGALIGVSEVKAAATDAATTTGADGVAADGKGE